MAGEPPDSGDRTTETGAGNENLDGVALPHGSSTWKVLGELGVGDGIGVLGHNTATSGKASGVQGVTDSESDSQAAGVRGIATGSTGITHGLFGKTRSGQSDAAAVWANAPEGRAIGVLTTGRIGVQSTGREDHGVIGETNATTTSAAGVRGVSNSGATGVVANGRLGLDVTGTSRDADPPTPQDHAAIVRDQKLATSGTPTSVLALKTNATSPDADDNFLTFFNAADSGIGAIEGTGSGVTLDTSNADYAEFLPRLDPDEETEPADVVGVVGGEVSKRTTGAEGAMVVTDQPVVSGNSPGQGREARSDHERVAFVGQVPAKVRGAVEKGDLIVPSGEHDGTGRAIPGGSWSPGDGPVVGRAWEATDFEGVDEVTVAVGLETGEALEPAVARLREELDRKDEWIEELATEVEALKAEKERLRSENETLAERLAGLEDRLTRLETGGTSAASVDD